MILSTYRTKHNNNNNNNNISTDNFFMHPSSHYTVEPLKEDPPIKGHCINYLSPMDKTKSPNFIPLSVIGTS